MSGRTQGRQVLELDSVSKAFGAGALARPGRRPHRAVSSVGALIECGPERGGRGMLKG